MSGQDNFQTLASLLLPDGVLDFFDITDVRINEVGLTIHLEERNVAPAGYKPEELESKGFLPEIRIQDFPVRSRKAFLSIRRRRWEVKSSAEIISRDWKLVQTGTRITKEFASFLKGVFR
jgi:hypothetical protein